MEALSVLKNEHSTILGELYQMDKQLAFLESSGPIRGARILRELVETSRRMSKDLGEHINKEEKVLFTVLETRLGRDRNSVKVMRQEHAELLASLGSLRTELDRMTGDRDTTKTWNLVSILQGFRGGLSDHLSREIGFLMIVRKLSKKDKTGGLHCIACKGVIQGKPRFMMLQITTDEIRFVEKAKKLGFTSASWRRGDSMKGNLHNRCFNQATLIWEVAFETRAVSPRR